MNNNLQIWNQEEIKQLLSYNPESGMFIWLKTVGRRGKKGSQAGTVTPTGYVVIYSKRKRYSAHRLAFLFIEGSFPEKGVEIDHIDGNRSNNVWTNLRKCSKAENQQNRKLDADSSSGLMGACKIRQRWYSQITFNGKKYSLGYYDTKEEAHQAYLSKKADLHTFNPVPRNS